MICGQTAHLTSNVDISEGNFEKKTGLVNDCSI